MLTDREINELLALEAAATPFNINRGECIDFEYAARNAIRPLAEEVLRLLAEIDELRKGAVTREEVGK